MDNIETIELGELNESAPKIILNDASIQNLPSVNFGPGADLLMNQGRSSRPNSPKSDITLSELKSLDLEEPVKKSAKDTRTAAFNMSVPTSSNTNEPTIKLNINEPTIAVALNVKLDFLLKIIPERSVAQAV